MTLQIQVSRARQRSTASSTISYVLIRADSSTIALGQIQFWVIGLARTGIFPVSITRRATYTRARAIPHSAHVYSLSRRSDFMPPRRGFSLVLLILLVLVLGGLELAGQPAGAQVAPDAWSAQAPYPIPILDQAV